MSLMKKLTSAVVASSLVLGVAGVSFANEATTGAHRMQALGLIQGDENGNLNLNSPITRAEFVTVMVRAFGQENTAKILHGSNGGFTDVDANAWYSGYVVMAKSLMQAQGHSVGVNAEGTLFAPGANLTAPEAVAFAMKFMGVKENTTLAWPNSFLVPAVEAGLITEADKAAIDATPGAATRGFAFQLLDGAFYNYDLGNGKTVYTSIDTVAPVVTIDAVAETTTSATITVTGSASGFDAISIDTAEGFVALDVVDGKFSVDLELAMGDNDIVIVAEDLAGNVTTATKSVKRIAGAAATIEGEAITVSAGGTVDVTAYVADANGNAIADLELSGESTMGSYADGKFTAGTTAGTGVLTLTYEELTKEIPVTVTAGAIASVTSDVPAAPGKTVKLVAKDAHGNTVEGATFAAVGTGFFLDAQGNFVSSNAGNYTVSATKDGVTVEGTIGVYGAATKLGVETGGALVANGSTKYTITVKALDENGHVNTAYDKAVTADLGGLTPDANHTPKWENGVITYVVTAPVGFGGAEYDLKFSSVNGNTTIRGELTVDVVSQVATSLKINPPTYLAVNDGTATGTVQVMDQNGVAMAPGQSWVVDLMLEGSTATFDNDKTETTVVADGAGVQYTLKAKDANQTGTVKVTASYGSFASVSGSTSVVNALNASKVNLTAVTTDPVAAAGEGRYVLKVEITDRNGVPRAAGKDGVEVTLTFDTTDAKAQELFYYVGTSATNARTAGVAIPLTGKTASVLIPEGESARWIGVEALALTGSVSVEASQGNWTKSSSSVAFKAGDIYTAAFSAPATGMNVLANSPSKISVQLEDEAGNKVAREGVEVRFVAVDKASSVRLNGSSGPAVVKTDAQGIASADVTLLAYDDNYTIRAEMKDADGEWIDNLADATVTLNVQTRVVDSLSAVTHNTTTGARTNSFEAGSLVEVRVTARDNNGLVFANAAYANDNIVVKLGDATQAVEWELDDVNNVLIGTFQVKKAGAHTVTVTDISVAKDVRSTRNISVYAARYDKVGAEGYLLISGAKKKDDDTYTLTLKKGEATQFTVEALDHWGNAILPNTVGAPIPADITAINLGADTTYADVRTSTTGGTKTDLQIGANRTSVSFYLIADGDFTFVLDGITYEVTATN